MSNSGENRRWRVKTSVKGHLTFSKETKELSYDNVKILIPEDKRFNQAY